MISHFMATPRSTRLGCTRVEQTCISNILRTFTKRRVSTDFTMLFSTVKPWVNSKGMPPLSVIMGYTDLAELFVVQCRSLKLSHVDLYAALLDIHQESPCLGTAPFVTARNISQQIRKALEWFRNMALYREKFETVMKGACFEDQAAVLRVVDAVSRDENTSERPSVAAITVHQPQPLPLTDLPANTTPTFDTPVFKRKASFYSTADTPDQVESAFSFLTPDKPIKQGVGVELVAGNPGDSQADADGQHALMEAFAIVEALHKDRQIPSRPLCFFDPLETKIQSDAREPLQAGSGAIQRAITVAMKRTTSTRGRAASNQQENQPRAKPAKTPVTKQGRPREEINVAYKTKKRKCKAYKDATKVALSAGNTQAEAVVLAKAAYAVA
jgi:hypothetical protein